MNDVTRGKCQAKHHVREADMEADADTQYRVCPLRELTVTRGNARFRLLVRTVEARLYHLLQTIGMTILFLPQF